MSNWKSLGDLIKYSFFPETNIPMKTWTKVKRSVRSNIELYFIIKYKWQHLNYTWIVHKKEIQVIEQN